MKVVKEIFLTEEERKKLVERIRAIKVDTKKTEFVELLNKINEDIDTNNKVSREDVVSLREKYQELVLSFPLMLHVLKIVEIIKKAPFKRCFFNIRNRRQSRIFIISQLGRFVNRKIKKILNKFYPKILVILPIDLYC